MKQSIELSKRQLFALTKLVRKLTKRYDNFLGSKHGSRKLDRIINAAFIKDISPADYERYREDWKEAEPEYIKEKISRETNDGFKEAGEVLNNN